MGFTTTHSHGDGVCKIPDSACAAYREQQRIIALIKDRVWELYGPKLYDVSDLVSVIKGETE